MFIDAMKPPATASRSRIAHWIRRELDSAPPKAKSLVVTVWGDAIAPHGRRARRELRKELWWEGFGPLGPGLFVRPARRGESAILAATLRALGIQRHVTVIEGRDVAGTGGRTLRNFVRDCWDLDALASEYRAF